jgi:hypothetical protein
MELTVAQKTVESLNKAVINKLTILFKSVHALCLAGRPFSDFVWMSKLDQAKGLDIGQTLYMKTQLGTDFNISHLDFSPNANSCIYNFNFHHTTIETHFEALIESPIYLSSFSAIYFANSLPLLALW